MSAYIGIVGAGRIGRGIARMFRESADYRVAIADSRTDVLAAVAREDRDVRTEHFRVEDFASLLRFAEDCDAVIAATTYRDSHAIASAALAAGTSYFDLTEDRAAMLAVQHLAEDARPGQFFVPQCGLAPGFVSIVAQHLMNSFDIPESARVRAGALPQHPIGRLGYGVTWSLDGLLNEYCQPCDALHDGRRVELQPLEGLHQLVVDGCVYEAFHTSGGLGTLCDTWNGHIRNLTYSAIRYPGHRDLMQFLLRELRLSDQLTLLRDIFDRAVPETTDDVVVVSCSVTGMSNSQFVERTYHRQFYPGMIGRSRLTAIQRCTAASACAVVDMALRGELPHAGFVRQEEIGFTDFMANRFGSQFGDDPMTRRREPSRATVTVCSEAVPIGCG